MVLSDAPKEEIDRAVEKGEVTADQLVVHQQDIQAVVNALWSGGAEAMTLQKQRVISTTGIKCVGNTVVLHGVPYAPPYEITAIGDLDSLQDSLDSSDYIAGYKTYVDAHNLGYEVSTDDDVTMPAYDGSSDLRYAKAEHGEHRRPGLTDQGLRHGLATPRATATGDGVGGWARLLVGGDHDRHGAALVEGLTGVRALLQHGALLGLGRWSRSPG